MLNYEVLAAINQQTGVAEEDVQKVMLAFAGVLKEALTRRGEPVTVRYLGTFKFKQNKEDSESKDLVFTPLLD